LTGTIADELIDAGHILRGEPRPRTVVGNADKDRTAVGIGKCCHLRRQRLTIAHVGLELA
jgi:hypothetical protein